MKRQLHFCHCSFHSIICNEIESDIWTLNTNETNQCKLNLTNFNNNNNNLNDKRLRMGNWCAYTFVQVHAHSLTMSSKLFRMILSGGLCIQLINIVFLILNSTQFWIIYLFVQPPLRARRMYSLVSCMYETIDLSPVMTMLTQFSNIRLYVERHGTMYGAKYTQSQSNIFNVILMWIFLSLCESTQKSR